MTLLSFPPSSVQSVELRWLSASELACVRSVGSNRSLGASQLGERTDLQAVRAWLEMHQASPHTHAAYEREARRLLLWCARVRHGPLSALLFNDLEAYRAFLGNPQPAKDWVMLRKVSPTHPDWRPFSKALSVASANQAMDVLAALFVWLHGVGHLAVNPFVSVPDRMSTFAQRRHRRADVHVQRTIPIVAWARVTRHVAALPASSRAARLRWLVTLFWMGLRLSEVCSATMGNIFREADPATGAARWWLAVKDNCDRWRHLPVNSELLAELTRYRKVLGLSALPAPGENTPLVLRERHRDNGQHLGRAAIHKVVKNLFADVALELLTAGCSYEAAVLQRASAHWIRHTAATDLINQAGVSLATACDLLGHASIGTTRTYLNGPRNAMHDELSKRPAINWLAV